MKELDSVPKYHITNRPDHIAQLVERRASNPEVVGSNPNVVELNFQPGPVWFTQSSTLISLSAEYIASTSTYKSNHSLDDQHI